MLETVKNQAKAGMEKALQGLMGELKKVRTGRAQISMLDSIRVNYYGNPSPLNQVAALSTPDEKFFLIASWDVSIMKKIKTAIVKSDLGMTPQNDGKVVRLKVPELTEQRRKDLVKTVKKIVEEA